MKIGINASFLRKPATGIGQVTTNFIMKLVEFQRAHPEHTYILYTEESPAVKLPTNFTVKTFLPKWWKRDDLIRKVLWEKQVAREAAKDGCDVFLSLYQSSTTFRKQSTRRPARQAQNNRQKTIRHVMMVHDIIPRLFPLYQDNFRARFHWRGVEQGIEKADHIIAVSIHTKDDIVKELHIAEEKISVISIDASPRFATIPSEETIASVLKKYALVPGYIYHGGGLEIRKNTETLLRAYKSLCDKMHDGGYSIQDKKDQSTTVPMLVISGKIFDRKNNLATDVLGLIEELRLGDTVKLLGYVPDPDLPALYAGALFFVFPSRYEGFGLPVLEALHMHVPVLSSNTSSLPEVGGNAVLYADPLSITEMTAQMSKLLTDASLRNNLISQSQTQALQFSWDQCVQKVFTLLVK